MLRAVLTLAALAAVSAQPSSPWVEVEVSEAGSAEAVEQRSSVELRARLRDTQAEALLLYTEYSARTGGDLKTFFANMTGFKEEVVRGIGREYDSAPATCRASLTARLQRLQYDAQRAASFSAENHHKFLLGHMVVLRMHLNKSEEYIKKCERAVSNCGIHCETTPKVSRWRRHAYGELSRAREDLLHARRCFRDLATHARRKLHATRRAAARRASEAVEEMRKCRAEG
ncbi:uncharacterized protein LOC105393244 [Plutella xylostella]|uniref:uncharacterized protein LOC105393244 n=1 Tax=Plutella xylostella TaxID=51655 RepID=UPI002032E558|nr:uncharacterized protein LOC105393244 [Plutella xylostella]